MVTCQINGSLETRNFFTLSLFYYLKWSNILKVSVTIRFVLAGSIVGYAYM